MMAPLNAGATTLLENSDMAIWWVAGKPKAAWVTCLPAIDLGTGRTAVKVSAHAGHTCVLLDNATLKCFGRNDGDGKVGTGDSKPHGSAAGTMGDALLPVNLGTGRDVLQVSCGRYYGCAILDGGDVKCCGLNGTWHGRGSLDGNVGDEAGDMGDALLAVDLGNRAKRRTADDI